MASSAVLLLSNLEKRSRAVKKLWRWRAERKLDTAPFPDHAVQSDVDDVFLVLALIGDALLPLGVLDEAKYGSTLTEVHTALASCGHSTIGNVFEKIAEELKYGVVAGLAVCAFFAPMHVYRGFGACVFNDWDWGCPDPEHLERKARRESGRFVRKPDPQPNRPIRLAFDRAIQVLQSKALAFLSKRPSISAFAEQQPRYTPRPKKDVKESLSISEDWFREVEKRRHPSPPGQTLSSWGMPYATWTSQFSCQLTRDPELVMLNQMDPGRLLHAFLCRGALNLHEGEIMTLPPATPAEALVCWLTGLPGMTHKLVSCDAFDTAKFEKKAGKKLCSKIGTYPLPSKYVLRDPSIPQATISTTARFSMDSPVGDPSSVPPPYSASHDRPRTSDSLASEGSEQSATLTSSELGDRHQQMHVQHAATVPAPQRAPPPPPPQDQAQNIVTTIRRKPTPTDIMSFVGLSPLVPPERAVTAPPSQFKHELHSLDSAAPPPRPPKIPLHSSSTHMSSEPPQVPVVHHTTSGDMSGLYLQLLNAVAQGYLSPQ